MRKNHAWTKSFGFGPFKISNCHNVWSRKHFLPKLKCNFSQKNICSKEHSKESPSKNIRIAWLRSLHFIQWSKCVTSYHDKNGHHCMHNQMHFSIWYWIWLWLFSTLNNENIAFFGVFGKQSKMTVAKLNRHWQAECLHCRNLSVWNMMEILNIAFSANAVHFLFSELLSNLKTYSFCLYAFSTHFHILLLLNSIVVQAMTINQKNLGYLNCKKIFMQTLRRQNTYQSFKCQ